MNEEDESLFEKRIEMIDRLVFGYRRKKRRTKKSLRPSLTAHSKAKTHVNAATFENTASPSAASGEGGSLFVLFTSFASKEEKELTFKMMKAIHLDFNSIFTVDLSKTSKERLSLIIKRLEESESVIFVFILGGKNAHLLLDEENQSANEEELNGNFFTLFARKTTLVADDAACLIKNPSRKAAAWKFLKEARKKIDDLCERRTQKQH